MLRAEQDLVSLRQRIRAAGEQFGLADRRLCALSAASFELGGLMYRAGSAAEAEIALAEGPALQVSIRTPEATDVARVRRAVEETADTLRPLVDRFAVEHSGSSLSVSLLARLPAHAHGLRPALDAHRAPPEAAGLATLEQNGDLQRAVSNLHRELHETNRAMVALHAELDRQADRLRQAEDRLRLMLDSVHDYAICMLDCDGHVESWNAGAERLFGYAADAVTGRSFTCFYTAGDRDLGVPAEHLAAALTHGRFECEGVRIRQGGSAFDAHVLLTAARGADQVLRGFSLVVRNVTERRRMEDDLRRRAEDLAAANRAKEEFLATLSHELRTPLNAMLGWTRLLRMGKLDEPAHARALETIERNAHVQEQLIADILDVSRIVTGKLRMDLRPIDLAPIIDASVDAVKPTVDAKGIQLTCHVAAVGTVLGDPDRLQQVCWNLLSNAIKFTPPGGEVAITVERAGPNAVISVVDSGEGMPADLLPYVFDRFTQGDGSVTRLHGGLGLGLSIVRHIVELHGGEVQAWSEGAGRGARFSVHLPIRAIRETHETDLPLPHASVQAPARSLP